MIDKSKLMTIGEIANSLGITRRMILNYESRNLINPDLKDGKTGNRYYTLDSMTTIRNIRVLQDMGLSLDEIRGYFDDSTDLTPMLARLIAMRDELNLNIEKLQERMKPIGDEDVQLVTVPGQTIFCRTVRSKTIKEKTNLLRDIGTDALRRYGSDTTKRMYFIEYPLDDLELVSYCMAVPQSSKGEDIVVLPEVRALCLFHHGAYEGIPDTCKKLIASAEKHGLMSLGTFRHVYLEGPPQHKNPKRFITQILLPIKS